MLLKRSGEFVAFGYEAETIYNHARSRKSTDDSDVTDSDEECKDGTEKSENVHDVDDLLLFKHFKMMLLKNKVNYFVKSS